MKKNYFIKLLRKYLRGESTKEEKIFVEEYYELFQNESEILDTLSAQEKKTFKNTLKDDIWSNIYKSEETDKKARLINMRHVKLAAAAVAAIALISSLYFLVKKPAPKARNPVATSVTPEHKKNHVILLPDSSVVILSGDSKLKYPSSFDHLKTREVSLEGEAFFDIKHITIKAVYRAYRESRNQSIGNRF